MNAILRADCMDSSVLAVNWRGFGVGCVVGAGVSVAVVVAAVLTVSATTDGGGQVARAIWSEGNVGADTGATRSGRSHRTADPDRLIGPLARLRDAAANGEALAQQSGTLRHRFRQLSYHVLAPLTWLGTDIATGGEVVVTEDSDDAIATTIVYRFAPDGSVVASAPNGDLLGAFDATTPANREAVQGAHRHRINLLGRE